MHPLAPLIGPLKIAARDVNRVRGLEQVVAAVRERAGPGEPQDAIVLLARGFDDKSAEERRSVVAQIAGALSKVVELPSELQGKLGSEEKAGAEEKAPEAAPAPVAAVPASRQLLSALAGIGPARAAAFEKRGLRTVQDLFYFLPNRYEDRRRVTTVRDAPWTGRIVVVGRCTKVEMRRIRGGRRLLEATFADETGTMEAVWFNVYPSLQQRLERPPRMFVLSGEVKKGFRGKRSMAHPDLEELPEDAEGRMDSFSFGRIVPVYGEVEGVHVKQVRRIVWRALESYAPTMPDLLPGELRERQELAPLLEAVVHAHFPPATASLESLDSKADKAHERLIFDELFFLQLGLALRKRGVKVELGFAFDTSARILERALKRLPFQLTGAQRRSVDDILADMSRPEPMNRLLQGDVGSGKTAVAVVAALVAVANKKQAAIMAPTEILAEQHWKSIGKLLAGTGLEPPLLTASAKGKDAARVREGLRDGSTPIVVGTHALLSEGVDFQDLGLVVVDEQHRFGVQQRKQLIEKGRRPDVLVMTATPIPRTLAMTLYGDLDVSIIDELPPGRSPITTKVWSMTKREQVYEAMKKELRAGRQAYVVLPLIEESEAEELAKVRDATRALEELSAGPLQEFRLGLVHGRLASKERDAIMEEFRAGALDVLVATTVIEVGVDVPNATVMVVEHAERFGLSQLHQLRGRVGRGAAKSWCHLVADWGTDKSKSRLSVMAKTQDGFKISEEDLAIRGPGELIGTRQSGMPDLTVASLGRDQKILEVARKEAFALVEKDPELSSPENRALGEEVLARWGGRLSLGRVG